MFGRAWEGLMECVDNWGLQGACVGGGGKWGLWEGAWGGGGLVRSAGELVRSSRF